MSEKRKSIFNSVGATTGSLGLCCVATTLGLCCYGSLAVTLVGVTGAAAFSRLQPYQPIIFVVAGAMLAWAFWQVYSQPRRGLAIQIALWVSLALIIGSVLLLYLAPMFMNFRPSGD